MAEQPLRNYVAVTVNAEPRVFKLGEQDMPRRSLEPGFIFHSWIWAGASGVIGVKFSSWMIKHGRLTPAERSVVSKWNQSESDFEVFFGEARDYDHEKSHSDETGSACMMRMDDSTLAVCFPIHGSSIGKGDAQALAASLSGWSGSE